MKRPVFALLLALMILSLCTVSRGGCAETPTSATQLLDPDDPHATPEERLVRQRALIQWRIKQREDELKSKKIEAEARDLAAEIKASSSTQEIMAKLPAMLLVLTNEVQGLQSRVGDLMDKAGPALKQAMTKPEPKSYKLDVEAKLIGNQTIQLTGYGDEQVMFSAPLIATDPVAKTTLIGSFEFTAQLKPLEAADKVQVDYKLTMDVPVLQKYNYGGNNTSIGQMTFRSGASGKVVMKAGQAKQIVRIGENTITLTITPE